MALDFTHTVDVLCAPATAFAYVAEFENNPRWQGGMRACSWTSETRMEVGSTYVQEARFLGRRIDTHFRVTSVEPGVSIAIESTISTFPIQVTRRVEAQGEGRCRVSARICGQPTGLLKLFTWMVPGSVQRDYARLKELLEAGEPG